MKYIVVGAAGIAGALLRYVLGLLVSTFWKDSFPLATWLINLIGCFFLAYFTAYLFRKKRTHPYVIAAIGTGLIGSFTTFSTFSAETIQFLYLHQYKIALIYIFTSAIGGLFMSWAGLQMGNMRWKQFIQEENK